MGSGPAGQGPEGGCALKIDCFDFRLALKVPFAISRGTAETRDICIARIEHRGSTGYGEASPSAFYGDGPEKARHAIEGAASILSEIPDGGVRGEGIPRGGVPDSGDSGCSPFDLEGVAQGLFERFPESPSGRAAVETALWDLAGKLSGLPVFRMLGLESGPLPTTSFTVGVTDPGIARGMLDSLRRYPILKAKVGFGNEEALLELLHGETDAVLRVDANEGWSLSEAIEKINAYRERFSIEIFEQPLSREDLAGYGKLRQATDAVIIVDESIVRAEDVASWQGLADGVNIKLMKCGGLLQAVRIASEAGSLGMKVMLGCMVESSLAITAAAHLASLADYCDLDGNLLISNDPFTGVKARDGALALSELPGLGASPVSRL
jgi:L-alanine-DL-glutamate epimerase-like enolase superfamily enzyme